MSLTEEQERHLMALIGRVEEMEHAGGLGYSHNLLKNIQGGKANEYYHLTYKEYSNLNPITNLDGGVANSDYGGVIDSPIDGGTA
jgi:hypothetical protein